MKTEWIKVADQLPKDGQHVNIKDAGGIVRKNVLFEGGLFWKLRKANNVGHSWYAVEWQAIEKVGKKPKYENAAMDKEYEER